MSFLTVAEVSLQAEVAHLRRELEWYKRRYAPDPPEPLHKEPIDDVVSLNNQYATLQLALKWSAHRDDTGIGWRVIGQTRDKDGGFEVGYYVSEEVLYTAVDKLVLLGSLHERVIRQLAEKYGAK